MQWLQQHFHNNLPGGSFCDQSSNRILTIIEYNAAAQPRRATESFFTKTIGLKTNDQILNWFLITKHFSSEIIFYNYLNFSLGQFVPPTCPARIIFCVLDQDRLSGVVSNDKCSDQELGGRSRPEDQSRLVITRPNYYFLILSPGASPAPRVEGVVPGPRSRLWRWGPGPGNRVQGYQRLSQECKISDGNNYHN